MLTRRIKDKNEKYQFVLMMGRNNLAKTEIQEQKGEKEPTIIPNCFIY